MDKSYFMYFVNSVRWNCTILMKTTRLNEDIDRAVRGVCDIRPEYVKMQIRIRNMIVTSDDFSRLDVLIVYFDELGSVMLIFKNSFRNKDT